MGEDLIDVLILIGAIVAFAVLAWRSFAPAERADRTGKQR